MGSCKRQVTTDIYNDARGQNSLLTATVRRLPQYLDSDTEAWCQDATFDTFKSSLSNSVTRLGRTIQATSGNSRLLLYVVGGIVGLFLVWHFFL
jgi:hypothetical protein